MTRRLIEEIFPVKEISQLSSKEKGSRAGHISSFHVWWARRPLAASRSVNYSSLVEYIHDNKKLEKKLKFILDLSKWENSNKQDLLKKAEEDIMVTNNGTRPKVFDPFGGGGVNPFRVY